MAGERFTAKARLDLDARPFKKGIRTSERAMKGFQGTVSQTQTLVSAALAVTTGFGFNVAIQRAQALWRDMVQIMERDARRAQAAAGGGVVAQDLAARAARERARAAAAPLGIIPTAIRGFGVRVAAGALRVAGFEEGAQALSQESARLFRSAKDAANATMELANGLEISARQATSAKSQLEESIRGMIPSAEAVGLGAEFAQLLQAAVDQGAIAAVTKMRTELVQELKSRQAFLATNPSAVEGE